MKNIEELYAKYQSAVEVLQKALNVSFASALTETFDNLENEKIKVEQGVPDKDTVAQLTDIYRKLDYDHASKKEKVEIFTLLTLKAINDDGRNYTQMPTPTIIATVIALMWQKLVSSDAQVVIDPAIGTGNLLYSVIRQLVQENHSKNNYELYGIDNDESLLDLADVGAHLDGLKINLYRQDALDPWMVGPADVIVSDLPVGYYPLDNNAQKFENRAKEGHSFAHVLFIEQIVNNLKKNGFAFLVVPRLLFTSESVSGFMQWLAKKVNLRAIVDLPSEMFASQMQQKSILVFQNHGDKSAPGDVLVAKLDSLKDPKSLVEFNIKLNDWFENMQHK
ncbi:class I SAM-dependent methyltransferase [Lactobacillus hominis]|uniref:class I SAM-dependent methyltransferase n=1 Tax=Lactobacillus hominis TaxID=1203033 RepID=UPI0023F40285|nr:class I SAM-dependent methyltransferase [Lactobacillus hominis]